MLIFHIIILIIIFTIKFINSTFSIYISLMLVFYNLPNGQHLTPESRTFNNSNNNKIVLIILIKVP